MIFTHRLFPMCNADILFTTYTLCFPLRHFHGPKQVPKPHLRLVSKIFTVSVSTVVWARVVVMLVCVIGFAYNELLRVSNSNKIVCLFHVPCSFQLERYSIEERKLVLLYFWWPTWELIHTYTTLCYRIYREKAIGILRKSIPYTGFFLKQW